MKITIGNFVVENLRKQIIKQGYRNLMGHISSSHPDHLELFHEAQQLSATYLKLMNKKVN